MCFNTGELPASFSRSFALTKFLFTASFTRAYPTKLTFTQTVPHGTRSFVVCIHARAPEGNRAEVRWWRAESCCRKRRLVRRVLRGWLSRDEGDEYFVHVAAASRNFVSLPRHCIILYSFFAPALTRVKIDVSIFYLF